MFYTNPWPVSTFTLSKIFAVSAPKGLPENTLKWVEFQNLLPFIPQKSRFAKQFFYLLSNLTESRIANNYLGGPNRGKRLPGRGCLASDSVRSAEVATN